jgi:tellurite resistance protein
MPNVFAVPLGLVALAEVWWVGSPQLHVSEVIPETIDVIAAAALALVLALYVRQGVQVTKRDVAGPTMAPFLAVPPIVGMLLGEALSKSAFVAGRTVVIVSLAGSLLLGASLTGRWVISHLDGPSIHPAYFVPTVAAGFVGSFCSAEVGLHSVAEASFGVGVISWLLLSSIVWNRLFVVDPLPPALVPTLAILLAPPAIAGVAYFSMTNGSTGMVSRALGGFALLMALVQVRFIPIYRKLSFSIGFWAFAFSYAVTGVDGLRWLSIEKVPGSMVYSGLIAGVLTCFVAVLAIKTARVLWLGQLPRRRP